MFKTAESDVPVRGLRRAVVKLDAAVADLVAGFLLLTTGPNRDEQIHAMAAPLSY